jgi:hypothetical protein
MMRTNATRPVPFHVVGKAVVGALLLLSFTARAQDSAKRNGAMVPAPSATGELPLAVPPAEQLAQQMTIFLDFEGPQINYAELDDSHTNTSHIQEAAIDYAPYGDATARAALVQAVRTDWQPYAVTITETRPAAGDYVMTVVSPTNPYGGMYAGIAPLDCMDTWTRNNVVFAFHGAGDGYAINEQARTIGQEVAHSIGLEHTTDDNDIMSYAYGPADFWFVDGCSQILLTEMVPEVYCVDQHALFCPADQQNSHAELVHLVGAGAPDLQGPTISIASPLDGAAYVEGASFAIEVDATDEVGVVQVELFVDGASMALDGVAPYGWPVEGIPPGYYAFEAHATDVAGNLSVSETVTIEVMPALEPDDEPDAESSGGDEPEDDDEASGSEAPENDDDTLGDALPPGFGLDRGDSAGCVVGPHRHPGRIALLLPLVGLALRRRRRVASSKLTLR